MVGRSMLHVVLVITAACGHNPPQSSEPGSVADRKPSMQQLTIVTGSARHVLDTGYGVVYQAPVNKVVEGALADRKINLHLFSNPDGKLYSGHFRSFDEPPVTLRFSLAPGDSDLYEGFTAADGTAWKLVSVDPK
jgi:hypothetical protein